MVSSKSEERTHDGGAAGTAPAQMDAKYVVYWRQEDGRWKWHVDIWNSNV